MINENSLLSSLPDYQDNNINLDNSENLNPKKIDETKRANELDGKTWIKYSISIWSDIYKTSEEIALGHPAIFPVALVKRLIEIYIKKQDCLVFDPFAGIGSTLVLVIRFMRNNLIWRDLLLILQNQYSFPFFQVPSVLYSLGAVDVKLLRNYRQIR